MTEQEQKLANPVPVLQCTDIDTLKAVQCDLFPELSSALNQAISSPDNKPLQPILNPFLAARLFRTTLWKGSILVQVSRFVLFIVGSWLPTGISLTTNQTNMLVMLSNQTIRTCMLAVFIWSFIGAVLVSQTPPSKWTRALMFSIFALPAWASPFIGPVFLTILYWMFPYGHFK